MIKREIINLIILAVSLALLMYSPASYLTMKVKLGILILGITGYAIRVFIIYRNNNKSQNS